MIVSVKHLDVGHPNRPGIKLEELLGIVIHYTANAAPGATDLANVKYMGRSYYRDLETKTVYEGDRHTPFRFGSAHIFCDEDSIAEGIPTDEVAWSCGDRAMPFTELDKGQQPLARLAFGNRQNYKTVSVEICNNGDWTKAAANAAAWVREFLKEKKLGVMVRESYDATRFKSFEPGKVIIVRHYDVTGKLCPRPYVDNYGQWVEFVNQASKT